MSTRERSFQREIHRRFRCGADMRSTRTRRCTPARSIDRSCPLVALREHTLPLPNNCLCSTGTCCCTSRSVFRSVRRLAYGSVPRCTDLRPSTFPMSNPSCRSVFRSGRTCGLRPECRCARDRLRRLHPGPPRRRAPRAVGRRRFVGLWKQHVGLFGVGPREHFVRENSGVSRADLRARCVEVGRSPCFGSPFDVAATAYIFVDGARCRERTQRARRPTARSRCEEVPSQTPSPTRIAARGREKTKEPWEKSRSQRGVHAKVTCTGAWSEGSLPLRSSRSTDASVLRAARGGVAKM